MTRIGKPIGRSVLAAVAGAITGILASSCTCPLQTPTPPATSPSAGTAPTPAAPATAPVVTTTPAVQRLGSHWVQDKRLRTLMADLGKQNPTWPAGLPQDPETPGQGTQQEFDEVATLATALMYSADLLPDVGNKISMNEADRRGFLAEAQVLHDQAERLAEAARHRRVEQMQVDMKSLNATCISCHSRYRDFSGQLDSSQAMARQAVEPSF